MQTVCVNADSPWPWQLLYFSRCMLNSLELGLQDRGVASDSPVCTCYLLVIVKNSVSGPGFSIAFCRVRVDVIARVVLVFRFAFRDADPVSPVPRLDLVPVSCRSCTGFNRCPVLEVSSVGRGFYSSDDPVMRR